MAELTHLGRYQIKRVLGKGAMGVVYEGYDPTLGRQVAIKTILRSAAHDAETERSYSERFAREARAVARLNHPNIVQVHDFAEEADVAYLVMEYIEGRELRAYFQAHERFALPEVVRIMGELLDALEFAHEAGVIHRDVKPANVMLDARGRVKLADFGVARIQDSERTSAGTMVGTPAYMSPEQVRGGKVDRRADVFSAGVVLYQLLTGEQPFKGEGAWTVATKIMNDDAPLPSAVTAGLAPLFDGIVDKALAKDPAERFASAREFAAALRSTQGGSLQAPAYLPRPRTSGAASDATVAMEAPRVSPAGPRAAFAAAALALLLVGAATFLWLDRPAQPAKAEISAAELETIKREVEERVRRELADKSAAEQAAAAQAATEKAVSERLSAAQAAAEKAAAAEKVAAEKAAAEKAAAQKALAERAAAERAEAEKAVAEKAAVERVAAERAAAERAVVEKAAVEKAAVEKAAAEKVAADKRAADKSAVEKRAAEKAAAEKATADKAAAEKLAGNSAYPLESFVQRVGRDKVVSSDPPDHDSGGVPFLRSGEIVYVNDGSCGPGRIKEITGGAARANRNVPLHRPSRCISLADDRAIATKPGAARPVEAGADKGAAPNAAADKATTASVADQLERFIQRVGRDKVVAQEPPDIAFSMRHGEVLYINDGSCGTGRIKEVVGMPSTNTGGSQFRPTLRPTRCISLAD